MREFYLLPSHHQNYPDAELIQIVRILMNCICSVRRNMEGRLEDSIFLKIVNQLTKEIYWHLTLENQPGAEEVA